MARGWLELADCWWESILQKQNRKNALHRVRRHDSQRNVQSSVEGDYIWYLRVIGLTDMLTDTAVTVDVSSDHHPMIGAGPESPARSHQIRQHRGVDTRC
jgi:hypothetical protein